MHMDKPPNRPSQPAYPTTQGVLLCLGSLVYSALLPRPTVSCKPQGIYRPGSRGGPSSASSLFQSARAAVPLLQEQSGSRGPVEGGGLRRQPGTHTQKRSTPISLSPGGLHQLIHSPTAKPASPFTPRNHRVTNEVSMEVPIRHYCSRCVPINQRVSEMNTPVLHSAHARSLYCSQKTEI